MIIMRSSATREARARLMLLLGRVGGVDGCSQQDASEASVARLLAICRHGHLCRPLPGG